MRRAGLILIAAVVVLGGVYLGGYLPERSRRVAAEADLAAVRSTLAAAEARVRAAALLGQALTLKEVAMRQNYGQALELSPRFFDAVRTEAQHAGDAGLRDAMIDVSARRDPLTAALAKAEPATVDMLHAIEVTLRQVLGYGLPPEVDPAGAR